MSFSRFLCVLALAFLMAGCGAPVEGVSGTGMDTGTLSLRITDAPIDNAKSVVVQFSAVQIRGVDTSQNIDFNFDPPKSIDLLTLQGSQAAVLLADETVPAGIYNELRLIVDADPNVEDSYISFNDNPDVKNELKVPSGSQSGLKLKGPVTVGANQSARYTVDFDVRKSIVKSGNPNNPKYHLKPVLRLVEDNQTGSISGSVDASLLSQAAGCSDDNVDSHNAVYVYQGFNVTPDDIDMDESSVEPVVTALVKYDAVLDSHRYEVAFLQMQTTNSCSRKYKTYRLWQARQSPSVFRRFHNLNSKKIGGRTRFSAGDLIVVCLLFSERFNGTLNYPRKKISHLQSLLHNVCR